MDTKGYRNNELQHLTWVRDLLAKDRNIGSDWEKVTIEHGGFVYSAELRRDETGAIQMRGQTEKPR